MNNLNLHETLSGSEIALGCMRIADMTDAQVADLLAAALENGINFFDHADIYGGGESESVFARAVAKLGCVRDSLVIQTKCGIRKGFYDFSKEHILTSVENSLRRLNTDYVDALVLHRPDVLMHPEEVAEAFHELKVSGKVRFFGVSNFRPTQIELLQSAVPDRLIINQMQFGVAHTGMIDSGINVNTLNAEAVDRDGSVLEYCQLKKITVQTWSPFQYGAFQGVYWSSPHYEELTSVIEALAKEKGVSAAAVAIAWILRHPAKMQVIVGTTNSKRLADMSTASGLLLSREEWYKIYLASGKPLP